MAKERSVPWGGSWAHCEEFYNLECKWRVCVLFVLCYNPSKHLLSLNIWNKLNVNDTVGSKQMTTWYWRRCMVSSHGFPWFLLGQMKMWWGWEAVKYAADFYPNYWIRELVGRGVWLWRQEYNFKCHFSDAIHTLFEAGSLIQLVLTKENTRELPVSPSSALPHLIAISAVTVWHLGLFFKIVLRSSCLRSKCLIDWNYQGF